MYNFLIKVVQEDDDPDVKDLTVTLTVCKMIHTATAQAFRYVVSKKPFIG